MTSSASFSRARSFPTHPPKRPLASPLRQREHGRGSRRTALGEKRNQQQSTASLTALAIHPDDGLLARDADEVMRGTEGLQRELDEREEEEGRLQEQPSVLGRHVVGSGLSEAPNAVYEVLRSPGQPLDSKTREFMESRLHHDFRQVRIHTDAKAAQSAEALDARAYTLGHHVVFGPDQYAPGASPGRWLIAHELGHMLQSGDVARTVMRARRKRVEWNPRPVARMRGTFKHPIRSSGDKAPGLHLGPGVGEVFEEYQRTGKEAGGFHVEAAVSGLPDTRGWVFFVQNIMRRYTSIRLMRDNRVKTCGTSLEGPVLDTAYPYPRSDPQPVQAAEVADTEGTVPGRREGSAHRFVPGTTIVAFLETVDSPEVYGEASEAFEAGDVMELSTVQMFRMFLAWDRNEKPGVRVRKDPTSLGYVDWGWVAAGRFTAEPHGLSFIWQGEPVGGPIGGGAMVETPDGTFIEVNRVTDSEELDQALKHDCESKEL